MKRRGIIFPSLQHEPAFIFRLDTLSIGIKTCIESMLAMLAYIYIGFMFRTIYVCERCICTERICHVYINGGALWVHTVWVRYGCTGVPISIYVILRIAQRSNVIGIGAYIAYTQQRAQ